MRAYNCSQYCKKSEVAESFENLIKNIMQKYGRYDLTTTEYQRFKVGSNRFNKTTEYLYILEKQ
ncbi:hypothetical protein [uncultured Gammaproteobacteria bacterium]|nr:hypothetical protein [uncultured Gammaproteobacteria bacterium]